jgi:hypothetical protein
MSVEDVANARRAYELLNEAYRRNDASLFRPILEEFWDREAVFVPAGVLPDSEVVHGRSSSHIASAAEPTTQASTSSSRSYVITQRRGKTVRLDVYETKEQEDLGLEDFG